MRCQTIADMTQYNPVANLKPWADSKKRFRRGLGRVGALCLQLAGMPKDAL